MKLLAIITAILILTACSGTEPRSTTASPPPGPAPAVNIPPVPAQPAPPAPRTDVLSVRFREINEQGYPVVIVTNLTDRDIDDISGGFRLRDASGNILHATGWTIDTPGTLLLARGAEMDSVPFGLSRKTDLMQRLRTEPEALTFSFEVATVTFMDDEE